MLEKQIYVHNPEVLDPGEEGEDTILGVDSDSDGVRDDVQRWINFESREDVNLKEVLKKLARNWQENVRDVNDFEKSQEHIGKRYKIESCLEGIVNDEVRSEHLEKMMEYMIFYTEDRFFVRERNKENYAGIILNAVDKSISEKINDCHGI